MAGKEPYFLNFNKDYIFTGLIAVEEHFRNVKPEYDAGDLSCVVKHAGSIESHADEAVSHALIAEGEEQSRKFVELRDMIREFRMKVQRGKIIPEEGIREIRQIRAFFESFNQEYDISRCKTCGPIPEDLKKVLEKVRQPSYGEMEEEMADRLLTSLSERYGVPKPKLEVVEECHKPEAGVYVPDMIRVCRGGINERVLFHEFGHHLQYKSGKVLDEAEAERFALNEIREKGLYFPSAKYTSGNAGMKTAKDIAVVYGVDQIGMGIVRGLDWLDAQYPGAILGQNPSLILDLAITIGGIYGAMTFKDPWDTFALLLGGYVSTDLWRQAEKMTLPAVRYTLA